MPAITEPSQPAPGPANPASLFPPITRDHILHCSYDSWFPKCVFYNKNKNKTTEIKTE